MAKIKWTKDDVIDAVNKAYESLGIGKEQPVAKPTIKDLLSKVNPFNKQNNQVQ
jgi:hypothetical protein